MSNQWIKHACFRNDGTLKSCYLDGVFHIHSLGTLDYQICPKTMPKKAKQCITMQQLRFFSMVTQQETCFCCGFSSSIHNGTEQGPLIASAKILPRNVSSYCQSFAIWLGWMKIPVITRHVALMKSLLRKSSCCCFFGLDWEFWISGV